VTARSGTVDQNLIAANAQHRYEVHHEYLWNSHPKVFLPIEQEGEAKCPYCGATYYLKNEE
jgi:uncharacterized Zn-finger protein